MAELKERADDLLEHAGDYIETYYKLGLLKVTEKSTAVGSSIIAALLLTIFSILFVLFIGLGLALWIGGMLESIIAGYFIVAGIYLLIIVCVLMMRKKTIDPFLRNYLVKKIYE
ncbi:hypothetical protein [Flavitalea sp.]|nr:hypothetical protein [Flavitalea sp.]